MRAGRLEAAAASRARSGRSAPNARPQAGRSDPSRVRSDHLRGWASFEPRERRKLLDRDEPERLVLDLVDRAPVPQDVLSIAVPTRVADQLIDPSAPRPNSRAEQVQCDQLARHAAFPVSDIVAHRVSRPIGQAKNLPVRQLDFRLIGDRSCSPDGHFSRHSVSWTICRYSKRAQAGAGPGSKAKTASYSGSPSAGRVGPRVGLVSPRTRSSSKARKGAPCLTSQIEVSNSKDWIPKIGRAH